MSVRAEILDTKHPYRRAAKIRIDAPPWLVFDLLANPHMHAGFDGSGTVQRAVNGPSRLFLGARFSMSMRIRVPYRISNTVVEFEENRRIAWRHFGGHRWRYELVPEGEGTIVVETFDGSTSRLPQALHLMHAYDNNEKAIAKTLVRLKALAESMPTSS